MRINDYGVLLQGPAGIGKSELALGLIDRGQQLVCDDAPVFVREHDKIIGHCPESLEGLLHVRHLGILSITKLFGEKAVVANTSLDLTINLQPDMKIDVKIKDLLQLNVELCKILGVDVPQVLMPVCQPLLIDILVSQLQLREQGTCTFL